MKTSSPASTESAAAHIDARIAELGDWRGEMLSRIRALIKEAVPDVVEEWKWSNPVWWRFAPTLRSVHIREAFMVRQHPQWIAARDRVRSGAIGELRFMQVGFSYFNDDPSNIRNQADIGGGALYDIGCYAIAAGRWFFEAEVQQASASMDLDPAFGTDRSTSGWLDFGSGRQLGFSVSTQAAPYQRIVLAGTRGRLEIEIPFNAPPDATCRYWIDDGSSLTGASRVETVLPVADQYQLQAEAFSRAVRHEQPDAAALDDAAWNMRTIDALFASARSGRFERL